MVAFGTSSDVISAAVGNAYACGVKPTIQNIAGNANACSLLPTSHQNIFDHPVLIVWGHSSLPNDGRKVQLPRRVSVVTYTTPGETMKTNTNAKVMRSLFADHRLPRQVHDDFSGQTKVLRFTHGECPDFHLGFAHQQGGEPRLVDGQRVRKGVYWKRRVDEDPSQCAQFREDVYLSQILAWVARFHKAEYDIILLCCMKESEGTIRGRDTRFFDGTVAHWNNFIGMWTQEDGKRTFEILPGSVDIVHSANRPVNSLKVCNVQLTSDGRWLSWDIEFEGKSRRWMMDAGGTATVSPSGNKYKLRRTCA